MSKIECGLLLTSSYFMRNIWQILRTHSGQMDSTDIAIFKCKAKSESDSRISEYHY